MKRMIATAIATAALAAYATPEWIHTEDRPVSGDRVVINDKTYVLMSVEDFAAFTNKIAFFESIASRRWAIQHATEHGRSEWHGPRVHQTFEEGSRITEYADGYRHVEKAKQKEKTKAQPAKPNPKEICAPLNDTLMALRDRRANMEAK